MKKLFLTCTLLLTMACPAFADDCSGNQVWDSINSECIANPCKDDNANGTCITDFADVQTRPGNDYKFLIKAHTIYQLGVGTECVVSDAKAKFVGQDYVVAYCNGYPYVYEFDDIEDNSLVMLGWDALESADNFIWKEDAMSRNNIYALDRFNEALCLKALGGIAINHSSTVCYGLGETGCDGVGAIYRSYFEGDPDVSVNNSFYFYDEDGCYMYYEKQ